MCAWPSKVWVDLGQLLATCQSRLCPKVHVCVGSGVWHECFIVVRETVAHTYIVSCMLVVPHKSVASTFAMQDTCMCLFYFGHLPVAVAIVNISCSCRCRKMLFQFASFWTPACPGLSVSLAQFTVWQLSVELPIGLSAWHCEPSLSLTNLQGKQQWQQ